MDLQTTVDLSRNRGIGDSSEDSEDGTILKVEGLAAEGFHDQIQWRGVSCSLQPTRLVMRAEEWRRIKGSIM